MKKLLALVLALVMTLGLATVGTSAAFSDADSIEYKEAVDVMSAVGVLAGMDDGSFNPTGSLTREQGAKIITYILLGGKAAGDTLAASSAPFSDVAADRWSAGSIQYCVANGIIAGVGNNKFDPTGELTGYAFAKMLLGALGYSAEVEGLVGSEWQVNTAKLIQASGLSNDIAGFVGSATVTREVAAQMGLNALKADMVEYTGGVSVNAGDASVTVNSTRKAVTSTGNFANAIDNDGAAGNAADPYTVQLGEQVFGGSLKYDTNATDDFGRPDAVVWVYKNEDVSDVVVGSSEDLKGTFTKKVTYKDLYAALGSNVVDKIVKLEIIMDGMQLVEMTRANLTTAWGDGSIGTATEGSKNGFSFANLTKTNSDAIGYEDSEATYANIVDAAFPTGNSVKTEVYAVYDDTTKGYEVTIVCINNYVATATSDYNSTKKTLQLTAVTPKTATLTAAQANLAGTSISSDDFANITGVEKDDVLLYTAAYNGSKYAIKSITLPTELTGLSATSYSAGSNVTAGGTKYEYNRTAASATAIDMAYVVDGSTTYDIWVDGNGYIVYASGTSVNDYLYIPQGAYALDGNAVSGQNAIAKAIFSDGSKENITIDKLIVTGGSTYSSGDTINTKLTALDALSQPKANTGAVSADLSKEDDSVPGTGLWFQYTKSGSKYTLTLTTANNKLIQNAAYGSGSAKLDTGVAANSDTVFVVYNETSKTYSSYTGISKLPDVTTAYDYAAYVSGGYAKYVYLSAAATGIKDNSATTQTAYIYKPATTTKGYDATNKTDTYEYDAIVNGEKTTIVLSSALTANNNTAGGLYTWDNTTDGYPNLTRVTTNDTTARRFVLTENGTTLAFSGGTFNDGTNYLTVADDAKIWLVDATDSWSVDETNVTAIVNGDYAAAFKGYITVETKSSTDRTVVAMYFVYTNATVTDVQDVTSAVATKGTANTTEKSNTVTAAIKKGDTALTEGFAKTYKWFYCGNAGTTSTEITSSNATNYGATADNYNTATITVDSDATGFTHNDYMKVTVTATDTFGRTASFTSDAVQVNTDS